MARVQVDGYEFNFPKSRELYKFDEQRDKASPYYHGMSHAMKAVDVMVELDTQYLFIEIKRFDQGLDAGVKKEEAETFLINSLVAKFRDTFVYRYCENKLDKPIKYISTTSTAKAVE